jgi:16S rRNA pseudouridine516 synthase
MRLDKFLSHTGHGTRKEVKTLIKEKRIKVNNEIIKDPSLIINEEKDIITIDDEIIEYQEYQYFILFKPKGYITATEDSYLPIVMDLIQEPYKNLSPVGRLDKDTTGLLLITNNGKLNHFLLAPSTHVDKEYYVTLDKPLSLSLIEEFKNGIVLEDGYKCLPAKMEIVDDYHALLTIHEGKYHQVKRMFLALGYLVTDLHRTRMDILTLEGLNVGEYRPLTKEEITLLSKNIK